MMNTINDGIRLSDTSPRSFLMIGQSNMAGRGDVGDVPRINNEKCFMLRNGRWQKMHEPINPDRPIFESKYKSGISLAASFADELAKYTGAPVGLIPAADGGSCLDEWQKGGLLFDHAVLLTRLAMRTSVFSGIIWHQGESDCLNEEDLGAYREKFLTFIQDLREALGAEDIPFIAGELPRGLVPERIFADRPERFNRLLDEMRSEIPSFSVVSSEGIEMKSDGLHFSAQGQREFGKRYFKAYTELVGI